MVLIVSRKQTEKLIDMPQAMRLTERLFQDRAAGKLASVPRQRLSGSDKKLNFMAAWHRDWDVMCLRAYAGPANTITLYNGRSGKILAVFNANYLSALRTGAASGVAAGRLAPPGARLLGLIGCGWQASFQVEAVAQACGIGEVLLFSRNPGRGRSFIRQMKRKLPLRFTEAVLAEEVEEKADIIILATDSTVPILNGRGLKPHALVISMGANQPVKREVSNELIKKMDLVVVDDLPTSKIDSGDLLEAERAGILSWSAVVPLEQIITEKQREPRPRRILFKSHGIPDEDLALSYYLLKLIRRRGIRVKELAEI